MALYILMLLQLDESTKYLAKNKQPKKKTDIIMDDAENGKVNKAFDN